MPVRDDARDIPYLLSKFTETYVDYRGRLYVPKKCRDKLGIGDGDRVYIELEEGCFKVYTLRGLRKRTEHISAFP